MKSFFTDTFRVILEGTTHSRSVSSEQKAVYVGGVAYVKNSGYNNELYDLGNDRMYITDRPEIENSIFSRRPRAERERLRALRKQRKAQKNAPEATVSAEKTPESQSESLKLCELSAKVCPNPNPGDFTLWLEAGKEAPLEISLVTADGVLVLTKNVQPRLGRNEIPISVPNVAKGVYLLRVKQLGETATMRVVVY